MRLHQEPPPDSPGNFLSIARGSVAELGSRHEILGALGSIDDARLALVVDRCDHMGRSPSRLIARLAGGT